MAYVEFGADLGGGHVYASSSLLTVEDGRVISENVGGDRWAAADRVFSEGDFPLLPRGSGAWGRVDGAYTSVDAAVRAALADAAEFWGKGKAVRQ